MSDPHRTSPVFRTGPDERNYLLRRAEDHRELADRSDEAGARKIHLRLRQLYLERAERIAVVVPDQSNPQNYQERAPR